MPKYYIDSNVFFYAKIMDKKYGESCSKIIKSIFKGELEAATSVLTPIEVANAMGKYGLNMEEIGNTINAIFSLNIQICDLDQIDVIRISEEFNISPHDAVHIATMKKIGVTQILSVDRDFDRVRNIKRIDPEKF